MSLIYNDNEIYISFNQTNKYACFGTPIGFYIYSLTPFKKILSRKIEGGISLVKMLYESNILLFVGRTNKGSYPSNKLIIWDDDKKTILGEISYNNRILNIEVTKKHIIVCLERRIYIYHFESLHLIKSIDTTYNPNGIMSVSLDESEYLVYPGDKCGYINITKLEENYNECVKAHDNNIEIINLSKDGQYIATSSEKGTIIRIFRSNNLEQINEFRRGSDPCKINHIYFNQSNSMLLVSSNKGTIHIFNTEIDRNLKIDNSTFDSYGISLFKFALPKYFNSKWSFCQFNLPGIISYSIFDNNKYMLYAFGNDGQYYELSFEDYNNPTIERTIKYISDESDPFSERSSTIK